MSFKAVTEQYVKAIANQGKRRTRQGRDFFTKNETKALKFYADALLQIQSLGGINGTEESIEEIVS